MIGLSERVTPDDPSDVTRPHFNAILKLILKSAYVPFKLTTVSSKFKRSAFSKVGHTLLNIIILAPLSAHVISFSLSSIHPVFTC